MNTIQSHLEKFYSFVSVCSPWRWVLGGGVGVPCTVNPLHDGLTAEAEASKAARTFLSETLTIRPLRLAVNEELP